ALSISLGAISRFLVRLAALAIVMLQNWMRETARKHRPVDAWSGLIEASPEPRVGGGETVPRPLSPQAALVRIEAIRRSLLAEATSPATPLMDRQMVAVGAEGNSAAGTALSKECNRFTSSGQSSGVLIATGVPSLTQIRVPRFRAVRGGGSGLRH